MGDGHVLYRCASYAKVRYSYTLALVSGRSVNVSPLWTVGVTLPDGVPIGGNWSTAKGEHCHGRTFGTRGVLLCTLAISYYASHVLVALQVAPSGWIMGASYHTLCIHCMIVQYSLYALR